MQTSLPERRIDARPRANLRLCAVLCVAVLALSLLPMYAISLYNHPSYDDYIVSAPSREAWLRTGSLLPVIRAAFDKTILMYNTWQGGYTPTFLSAFQPAIFGESYYAVAAWVLLTAFLLCAGFFLRTVLRDALHADGDTTCILACAALTLMIQLQPDVGEGFFWFNSGVGYQLMEALMLLSLALVVKLQLATNGGKRILWTALLCPVMFLQGGSNPVNGLASVLVMAGVTVYGYCTRSKCRAANTLVLAVLAGAFFLTVSAPGNAARAAMIDGSMQNPVMAVLKACYYGVALCANWFTLPVLATLLLTLPLLVRVARGSGLRFAHPLLALTAALGLFCAQLTPTLYSGVHLGAGRVMNVYYAQYILLLFGAAFYAAGYLARRFEAACVAGSDWAQGLRRKLKVSLPVWGRALALAGLCVLVCGVAGYRKYGDESYGPQNTAGGAALVSLATGEARKYDAEMKAREAILNDESIPAPAFAPLSAVPRVFVPDLLRKDSDFDVTRALAAYYGKTAITLVDTPEEATRPAGDQ